MKDDLTAVEDWAAAFLQRLAPTEQRQLATQIARELRRSQAARIAAQKEPDGTAFTRRKPQKDLRGKRGAIKRGPMFRRLRLAKRLQIIEASGQEVAVGFTGRDARIARAHHEGLAERHTSSKGKEFTILYAQRRLLGLTEADTTRLMDTVLAFLDR